MPCLANSVDPDQLASDELIHASKTDLTHISLASH